jgi:hypothetical protein
MIAALAQDRRFPRMGDRKAIALELIAKEMDGILNGDDNHPCRWMRIADICRQEAGLAPMNIWSGEA